MDEDEIRDLDEQVDEPLEEDDPEPAPDDDADGEDAGEGEVADDDAGAGDAEPDESPEARERRLKRTIGKQGNEIGMLRKQIEQLTALIQQGQSAQPANQPPAEDEPDFDEVEPHFRKYVDVLGLDQETAMKAAVIDAKQMRALTRPLRDAYTQVAVDSAGSVAAEVVAELNAQGLRGVDPQEVAAELRSNPAWWASASRELRRQAADIVAKRKFAEQVMSGRVQTAPLPPKPTKKTTTNKPTGNVSSAPSVTLSAAEEAELEAYRKRLEARGIKKTREEMLAIWAEE